MTRLIGITSSLFLGIALLLPSSMASAELAGACLKDAKAMCPGWYLAEARSGTAFKTNLKGLSDECKDVLVKAVNVKA